MTQGGNRIQASYTSISWIPSEAIVGLARVPFDLGIGHYDEPPPDVVDDIETLYEAGGFRFANRLRAWIHVADGEIVAHGHFGHGYINRTLLRFAGVPVTFQPTAFPELRPPPAVGAGSVRFVQTTGGRAGVPAPRRVRDRPFFLIVDLYFQHSVEHQRKTGDCLPAGREPPVPPRRAGAVALR